MTWYSFVQLQTFDTVTLYNHLQDLTFEIYALFV